jgi:hypothetical protein
MIARAGQARQLHIHRCVRRRRARCAYELIGIDDVMNVMKVNDRAIIDVMIMVLSVGGGVPEICRSRGDLGRARLAEYR